jgi:hypothetical protein
MTPKTVSTVPGRRGCQRGRTAMTVNSAPILSHLRMRHVRASRLYCGAPVAQELRELAGLHGVVGAQPEIHWRCPAGLAAPRSIRQARSGQPDASG